MNTNLNMRTMPIEMLKPAKYNPRKDLKPGDPAYEKIKRSLHDFGYVDPIVWNEVTGNIVGHDLTKDPGLDRSIFGNGLSTIISGFFGSTPNTTYGENIGVLAITKVFSTWVIGGAAVFAILLSCLGKLAALIQSIPTPVMGGVSMLLFGVIAASGIRILVEAKVDYNNPMNLLLTSIVMGIGVSTASLTIGTVSFKGMSLATVVAIILSLAFRLIAMVRGDKTPLVGQKAEDSTHQ